MSLTGDSCSMVRVQVGGCLLGWLAGSRCDGLGGIRLVLSPWIQEVMESVELEGVASRQKVTVTVGKSKKRKPAKTAGGGAEGGSDDLFSLSSASTGGAAAAADMGESDILKYIANNTAGDEKVSLF